ncbi:MAG: YkvA family protein [Pyrinomonadaceae bacterium]
MSAIQARNRMKNIVLFIPNMIRLCARLMTDPRVPKTEKALVGAALVYAVIPLDLIPDMIPFVGQIDDVYLIAVTLIRLMDRTDTRVLREHWKGGGDVVELIETMAMMTAKLLPRRIRRVLTSRVEVSPGLEENAKKLRGPLLVVKPEAEGKTRVEIK